MNKAEFIQTLSGYVPEKLIDTLAEKAEWDGLFYEESKNAVDEKIPDYEFASPFMISDIVGRGHRRKNVERTFKELRAKVKDKVKDFSADNENVSRPSEMIEYASRDIAFIPDEVRNQTTVDINKFAEAIKNIPVSNASDKIRNLKLSELIYLFADRGGCE